MSILVCAYWIYRDFCCFMNLMIKNSDSADSKICTQYDEISGKRKDQKIIH